MHLIGPENAYTGEPEYDLVTSVEHGDAAGFAERVKGETLEAPILNQAL